MPIAGVCILILRICNTDFCRYQGSDGDGVALGRESTEFRVEVRTWVPDAPSNFPTPGNALKPGVNPRTGHEGAATRPERAEGECLLLTQHLNHTRRALQVQVSVRE